MPLAQRNELNTLPDGEYDISVDSADVHTRFQIYTVTTGRLAGQRIVKIKRPDGTWKGFANIRLAQDEADNFGGLYIWSRMRDQISQSYIDSVSRCIESFIARVRDNHEPWFIMIHDCPTTVTALRIRLGFEQAPEPEAPTAVRNLDNFVRARSVGRTLYGQEAAAYNAGFLHDEATVMAGPADGSAPMRPIGTTNTRRNRATRGRRCAMSFFDNSVVR